MSEESPEEFWTGNWQQDILNHRALATLYRVEGRAYSLVSDAQIVLDFFQSHAHRTGKGVKYRSAEKEARELSGAMDILALYMREVEETRERPRAR